MRLVKSGAMLAALSILALTFMSSSALADPIGRPWGGGGRIFIDFGLGGADCSAWTVAGARNGNTITSSTFGGCSGALGTPTALLPWAVTWNARDTGGTIAIAMLANFLGLSSCLWSGSLAFRYAAPTFTITSSVVPLLSGGGICPATLSITGSQSVN